MDILSTGLRNVLYAMADFGMLFLESMGVVVIVFAAFRAFFAYWRCEPGTRLRLAKSMAMALEFKLGSEILRTVVVHQWSELALVGGIILIRAALTLLIHWEIKNEENDAHAKGGHESGGCAPFRLKRKRKTRMIDERS